MNKNLTLNNLYAGTRKLYVVGATASLLLAAACGPISTQDAQGVLDTGREIQRLQQEEITPRLDVIAELCLDIVPLETRLRELEEEMQARMREIGEEQRELEDELREIETAFQRDAKDFKSSFREMGKDRSERMKEMDEDLRHLYRSSDDEINELYEDASRLHDKMSRLQSANSAATPGY